MKFLFNLLLLAGLCFGGFYMYLTVTEDYETLARIKNTEDQLLVEMQRYLEELKQEWEEMKEGFKDKKRSVGL